MNLMNKPILPPPVTLSDEEPIAAGGWRVFQPDPIRLGVMKSG
jgi:hypothetical protein